MILSPTDTILLYGDSGDGKTAQIGHLALAIYKESKKKTRLYPADQGGAWETVQPLINVGIIELEHYQPGVSGDPWKWVRSTTSGMVKRNGVWTRDLKDIGLLAYEGIVSYGEQLANDTATKAALGVHSGGEKRFALVTEAGTISGMNQTDYGLLQVRLREEIWLSQANGLPVVWSTSVRRLSPEKAQKKGIDRLIGPEIIGDAMTGAGPRWFKYCLRIEQVSPTRHVLYLGGYRDLQAGNLKTLGNARTSLYGTDVAVPATIEPADLVKALSILKQREAAATVAVKKEAGL